MGVTLRATKPLTAETIADFLRYNPLEVVSFDDNHFADTSGEHTMNIKGRGIQDAAVKVVFGQYNSVFAQLGLNFTDPDLFIRDLDYSLDRVSYAVRLLESPAPDGLDRAAYEQAVIGLLERQTGLRLDYDQFSQSIDRAAGLGFDDFNPFAPGPEALRALGISASGLAAEPQVAEVQFSRNGEGLFEVTGDDLSRLIETRPGLEFFAGDDTIIGTAGDDFIDGGAGADRMIGGDGNDHYIVNDAGDVVVENAGGGDWDRVDILSPIDGYVAPDHVEVVVLMEGVNEATTSSTGTRLAGLGDNNFFYSGVGNDFFDGNGGIDALSYEKAGAAVQASLLKPTAFNTGGAGTDRIDDIENLFGSAFDDVLVGGQGISNLIHGGAGDDLIVGFAGPDRLIGGEGRDTFAYNRINFRDSLIGEGEDKIFDFISGEDTIDLSRLRVSSDDLTITEGRLEADVDGDDVADFAIQFTNDVTLQLTDITGLLDAPAS